MHSYMDMARQNREASPCNIIALTRTWTWLACVVCVAVSCVHRFGLGLRQCASHPPLIPSPKHGTHSRADCMLGTAHSLSRVRNISHRYPATPWHLCAPVRRRTWQRQYLNRTSAPLSCYLNHSYARSTGQARYAAPLDTDTSASTFPACTPHRRTWPPRRAAAAHQDAHQAVRLYCYRKLAAPRELAGRGLACRRPRPRCRPQWWRKPSPWGQQRSRRPGPLWRQDRASSRPGAAFLSSSVLSATNSAMGQIMAAAAVAAAAASTSEGGTTVGGPPRTAAVDMLQMRPQQCWQRTAMLPNGGHVAERWWCS